MRGAFCAAVLILTSAPAQSQQPDVLRQLVGLWTAEWVSGGSSKVEQVQFNRNALNRHTAALPFLPGLATITLCQGQGCAGADIVVSGTGFDCLYTYSTYNTNQFAWIYKGGNGACPPSAKFTRAGKELDEIATLKKQLEDERQRLTAERRRLDEEIARRQLEDEKQRLLDERRRVDAKAQENRVRQSTLETREAVATRQPTYQSGSGATAKPHWCSEQSRFTDFEITICSNGILSQLDIQLENLYGSLIQSRPTSSVASIRATQRAWVQRRTSCGSSSSCLRQLYENRIQELNSY